MASAVASKAESGFEFVDSRSGAMTIQSAILEEAVPVSIYLPAGYRQSGRRYPTLYILEDDLYHRAMTGVIDTRTRLGAIPEMIEHNVDGFLIDREDQAAHIILDLRANRIEYDSISLSARRTFMRRFSVEKYIEQIKKCVKVEENVTGYSVPENG